MAARNTYRYRLTLGNRVILHGFTTDLARRETEHQLRWPEARVEPVGDPISHQEAWEWEKRVTRAAGAS